MSLFPSLSFSRVMEKVNRVKLFLIRKRMRILRRRYTHLVNNSLVPLQLLYWAKDREIRMSSYLKGWLNWWRWFWDTDVIQDSISTLNVLFILSSTIIYLLIIRFRILNGWQNEMMMIQINNTSLFDRWSKRRNEVNAWFARVTRWYTRCSERKMKSW